jgi:hypothetical protein
LSRPRRPALAGSITRLIGAIKQVTLAMTIPQIDRDRLLKLVGMLGSAHDGEKLSAMAFISRMAAAHKLTITELMGHVARPGAAPQQPQPRQPPPPQQPPPWYWRPPQPQPRSPPPPPPEPEPPPRRRQHTGLNGDKMLYDLDMAARYCSRLSSWERKFAIDVAGRYRFDNELSDKQKYCVADIIEKWKAGGA